jgi:SAM-dependent methyltransferase
MTSTMYRAEHFQRQASGSISSARAIVPIVLSSFRVTSVIDIGCGIGTWLKVFEEHGIVDIVGVDGYYVPEEQLLIDRSRFRSADLILSKPLPLERRFDLACCLEVAEHLPPGSETQLIHTLTDAAPLVLFSAAIPGQPGPGHINTRWHDHWAGIFGQRGYLPLDIVRPLVWGQEDVKWWYQQNVVIYYDPKIVQVGRPATRIAALNVVHPYLYTEVRNASLTSSSKDGAIRTLRKIVWWRLVRSAERWFGLRPLFRSKT